MSREVDITDQANTKLEGHFLRSRDNDYDRIEALLLYWELSDLPGCEQEATAFEQVLSGRLKYHVQHWRIPAKNPQLLLDRRIADFLTTLIEPRSLGIIHYGGHGDPDEQPNKDIPSISERKSVWASHREHGSTLSWSKIQEKLADVEADIFLVLDCCFAAQNMRNRSRVVPPNVEVLAACAMRLGTPAPGLKNFSSFTMALIKEIELALRENRPVIVKELFFALAKQDRHLLQSPIHCSLHMNKSIRLDTFNLRASRRQTFETSLATLALRIDVRSPVNDIVIDDILNWLMLNAPREISGVKIESLINRAQNLQRFVSGQRPCRGSKTSTVTLGKISDENKAEVLTAWADYRDGLQKSVRHAGAGTESHANTSHQFQPENTPASSITGFVSKFTAMTSILQNIVTRNILTIPELFDEETLRNEVESADQDWSQIWEGALEVRLAGCARDGPNSEPLRQTLTAKPSISTGSRAWFNATLSELVEVVIEYKYVDVNDPYARENGISRIKRLVDAMTKAHSASFRTPECLGYLSDDLQGQYGIVFKVPSWSISPASTLSLNWVLQQHFQGGGAITRPSLGERYKLVLAIGRALLQWHLTGWVHQGISSLVIMLFADKSGQTKYESPYLLGFEYAREHDASSLRRNDLDTTSDIYRHPDRQGPSPRKKNTKYHDMYSFGLLMVEIGLWIPLNEFKKTFRTNEEVKVGTLRRLGKGPLQYEMGRAFETATINCLTGMFDVDVDDRNETHLAKMFEVKVLREIQRGIQLDGEQ
ncbi:hypothetical protein N0V82_008458 [Gnomoniopsis sp. IMI 355080]|nr:hypothetical protein N0V82_008458 [Gnomoniopsis sp. IMI 355080]